MSSNTEIIRNAYEAFGRGDVEAVFAAFAPDINWVVPDGMTGHGLGGTRKGHQQVGEFFQRIPAVFGDLRVEPQEFVESGDRLVVLGTHHVTSPGGTRGDVRFAHSWTLSGGLATDFEEFFDTTEMNRILAA